jgi:membrane protein
MARGRAMLHWNALFLKRGGGHDAGTGRHASDGAPPSYRIFRVRGVARGETAAILEFIMSAFLHGTHRIEAPSRAHGAAYGWLRNAGKMIGQSVSAWIDDDAPSMGAAIAYYTVFSIAPLLVIVIAIAGAIFGTEAVHGEVAAQLRGLVGRDAALTIQTLIKDASKPAESALAGTIGAALLIIGATTVFAELQTALDRIWQIPAAARTPSGWLSVLRSRLLSFGLILALGFLLLVSLLISVAISAFGAWWSAQMGGWEAVLHFLNLAISFALTTSLFAMIYKLMPRCRIAWRDVWVGAAVTALLFEIGKLLIGLYVGKSGVASSFGAAGSVIVLLLWVYYSAQIFLLGAEFTWVYAHHGGSRIGQPMLTRAQAHEAQRPAATV